MARPGVMLYFDIRDGLQHLSVESRCAVYDAVMYYGEFGEVPEFSDPMAKMAWDLIRPRLDKDRDAYEKRRAKRVKPELTGEKRSDQIVPENPVAEQNITEQNTTEQNTTEQNLSEQNISDPGASPKAGRCTPPSCQEVMAYCEKNKISVDARHFVDYYTANGWKIGQNPIADWRAALRSWEKHKKEIPNGSNRRYEKPVPQLPNLGTRL